MIYSVVPFPVTLNDCQPRFQGHGIIIDALDILCAQLTRDLFAMAQFLFTLHLHRHIFNCFWRENVKPLNYFCSSLPMAWLMDERRLVFYRIRLWYTAA